MSMSLEKPSVGTTEGSAGWYERAQRVIAGGLGHDVRAASPHPLYIQRAEGAHKWDVDGNRYVDYNLGNGALLLGHAHPAVVEAVVRAAPLGTHFGNDHPLQVEWAELIQKLVPCAERVRFVNTGTEANMLAARVARAFTGRGKIIRFEGHFHGWHDDLVRGFSPPFEVAPSIGLAPGALDGTVLLPANDLDRLERALVADPDVAAVILEPSGASWSTVPLAPGFLQGLRELTRKRGVLLIFDEVITGFRWAPGGAQERYGIVPDLSTHAKVIGGGMPAAAAVCGRADVLDVVRFTGDLEHDRFRRVLHYGTYNATPVTAAAGLACLKIVQTGEPQRHADAMAERLRNRLDAILERRGVAGYAYGEASTFHVYLESTSGRRPRERQQLRTLDPLILKGMPADLIRALQGGLRARGVDLMSYNGGMLSAAHTAADVDETVNAFDDLIAELLSRGAIATLSGVG
jgi:glutamate-1-semialdehyde 2,1-aminomutase